MLCYNLHTQIQNRDGEFKMIDCSKTVMNKRIERTVAALKANNMNAYHISSREEMFDVLASLIPPESKVGYGGSMTLTDTGVIDWLRWKKDITLFDRANSDNPIDCQRMCLVSDVFLASSNAVTENGWLYNVDGRGNRVAAMIFGPKKVILVVGCNKIVPDIDSAIKRIKCTASPANAIRLNKDTPCAKTGVCMNCKSDDRICRDYVAMGPQLEKNRINVLILDECLGY